MDNHEDYHQWTVIKIVICNNIYNITKTEQCIYLYSYSNRMTKD